MCMPFLLWTCLLAKWKLSLHPHSWSQVLNVDLILFLPQLWWFYHLSNLSTDGRNIYLQFETQERAPSRNHFNPTNLNPVKGHCQAPACTSFADSREWYSPIGEPGSKATSLENEEGSGGRRWTGSSGSRKECEQTLHYQLSTIYPTSLLSNRSPNAFPVRGGRWRSYPWPHASSLEISSITFISHLGE